MSHVQAAGRIFVCVTCDRYAAHSDCQPTPGQKLANAVRQSAQKSGSSMSVRAVECLNGCPHPCTAALRAPGKAVIRFSYLNEADASALLDVATAYANSPSGEMDDGQIPERLRAKVSDQVKLCRA
jgi:predicted metal-binding protein